MKISKRRILTIIMVVTIIAIACFAVLVYAENTGGTLRDREDEKTLVRLTATLSMLGSSDNKVQLDTLQDELDSHVGTGVATATRKTSDTLLVTFAETGNEYEINVNAGPDFLDELLPETSETSPYLPTGFSYVTGTDLSNGLTIQDGLGNQYVWVSVPRDETVYNDLTDDAEDTGMSDTTNEDILAFDVNSLTADNLTAIETELKEYTATYRDGTSSKDEFYSGNPLGFADATAYNNHKNAMLTSVFKNEGFYVGKYETGIADTQPDEIDTNHEARTAKGEATQQPVIQANAYPYNFVTNKQAQELASTKFNGGGYTTSLMFGLQWDLVLKHLEVTNAASESELKSDSTEWGNYANNIYNITNESAKNYVSAWRDGTYEKTANGSILL